jgi:hypothetical protein
MNVSPIVHGMVAFAFAFVSLPTAFAGPLDRLANLIYQKGYGNVSLKPSLAEEIDASRGSVVYQVPYHDGSVVHTANIYKDHNAASEPWRIFLIRHDRMQGYGYLTGPDAQLLQVVKGTKIGKDWTWTIVPVNEGADAFQAELAYWRNQEEMLAGEKDQRPSP